MGSSGVANEYRGTIMLRLVLKCCATAGIALLFPAAPAFAQQATVPTATFKPILGPNGDNVVVKAINNSQTVVGIDTVLNDGVIIDASGNVTSFTAPGALGGSLQPVAINSAGEIAGVWLDQNLFSHIFFRYTDGTITSFSTEDFGLTNVSGMQVTGLNDKGAITGYYLANAPDGNFGKNGFVRSPEGDLTFFNAAGTNTAPSSISNSGAITGSYGLNPEHGFLRSPAGHITLFDVPGASLTEPDSINAGGFIAGTFNGEGFVRDHLGTITKFSVGGHQNDGAVLNYLTMNSRREITGSWHGLAGTFHGYLRSSHGTISFFDVPGSTDTHVCCINDSGVIAINASNGAFLRLPARQDNTFQPGTYLITDGQLLYVDGGFYLYGDPIVKLWPFVGDNTAQYWIFTRVKGGYTIQNQGTGQYASDGGGYFAETGEPDVWKVHAVSGGYQIENTQTGLFLSDPGVQDGPITLSDKAGIWQFLSLLN